MGGGLRCFLPFVLRPFAAATSSPFRPVRQNEAENRGRRREREGRCWCVSLGTDGKMGRGGGGRHSKVPTLGVVVLQLYLLLHATSFAPLASPRVGAVAAAGVDGEGTKTNDSGASLSCVTSSM